MVEEIKKCPRCSVPEEDGHSDGCPRFHSARLSAAMEKLGRPVVRWMKGGMAWKGRFGMIHQANNPGVPYVRQHDRLVGRKGKVAARGKPWNAGGVPKNRRVAVEHFVRKYFGRKAS